MHDRMRMPLECQLVEVTWKKLIHFLPIYPTCFLFFSQRRELGASLSWQVGKFILTSCLKYGGFHKWGYPISKNGCFIMENPVQMDNLGVPSFQETSIYAGILSDIYSDILSVISSDMLSGIVIWHNLMAFCLAFDLAFCLTFDLGFCVAFNLVYVYIYIYIMLSVMLFGILIWQLMFFLACDLHFVWQLISHVSVISSLFIWCLSDILSDTYSGRFSRILRAILFNHDILCDSWSGISSDILFGILSDILSGILWMPHKKCQYMCQIGFLIIRMPCKNGRILCAR